MEPFKAERDVRRYEQNNSCSLSTKKKSRVDQFYVFKNKYQYLWDKVLG
jgi:hypothetical protein